MALIDRQPFFGQLPSNLATGLDEAIERLRRSLASCLPPRLQRILARRDRYLLIEPQATLASLIMVSGDEREPLGELALAGTAQLPEAAHLGHDRPPPRVLLMPAGSVLTRTVSLPSQVRANLPQVIRYELDRLSPFQASDVLYDFTLRPLTKGAHRLTIDLALCRRDLAESWIKRLRESGAPIDRITWNGAWSSANLLPTSERPKRRLVLFSPDHLLWAAIILLALAALISPIWQKKQMVRSLDAEVQRARVEAIAVDDLRKELEQARLGSTAVLQQKWDAADPLLMLRELTDRLPDDTWLQTLDYDNGQVALRGESGQATSLIAILEQAPGIDQVTFQSPVTQIPQTGKERFNISLRFSRAVDE